MSKISVVIPVHNEEGNIPQLFEELKAVLEDIKRQKGYEYEVIFVNDGSTDNTLEVLKKIKKNGSFVRILNMDKNRGQAAGLSAGFYYATGEIIVSLDGDGQNDPKYIKDLINKLDEGYKVVTGYRIKRKAPLLTKRLPSKIANWLISKITGLKVRDNGCSLKAYRSPIPKKWQIPKGMHRFLPALFGVKNEELCEIPVIDRPRRFGKSHYGLKRTFEVLRDLFTIPFILKNPKKFEKTFKWLFIFSCFGTILCGISSYFFPKMWYLTGFGVICSIYTGIVFKNLKRFNKAQEEGVFKVTEV